MIGTIAKREILESIKSAKFLIGLLISLAIAVGSTVINVQDFQQRQQDYVAAQNEMKGNLFDISIYRPPQVLSILVQGKDRILGNKASVNYLQIPDRLSGYMGARYTERQRSLSGFGFVDFAFLVRVVLSLMVVFLTYNAVAEEKSFGTLKLALANALPRHHFLLGKFFAGLAIVLGSLLAAAAITVLILLTQPTLKLTGDDGLRIASLIVASALYLIVFYTLSLFVSTAINRPSIALMVLLQLWVFLVVIYPHLGMDIAEHFYRLPTDRELSQRKQAAEASTDDEFKKVRDAYFKDYSPESGSRYLELQIVRSQKTHDVDRDFGLQLSRQRELAQRIAILSPAVLFDRMAERYAQTGIDEYERFMQSVVRYWQTKYLDLQRLRYKDLNAYRKAQAPALDHPAERTAESWVATLPQGFVLAFVSLIFFGLAYTVFLKKDVR